jgi:hypothetical protein
VAPGVLVVSCEAGRRARRCRDSRACTAGSIF